jgi:Zn-dependent protease
VTVPVGRRPWARGLPLGRVAGVPVTVTPAWFLSAAAITVVGAPVVAGLVPSSAGVVSYLFAGLLAVLLGVSVLAHELGHCVVARSQGVGVVRVELFLLGGVSEISRQPRTASEEAAVAAAGPLVSAGLTGVFALMDLVVDGRGLPELLVMELAISNAIIAVFNLLPALPLDGGRVLRAGIWRATGSRKRATSISVGGGYLLAAALLAWSIWRLTSQDRAGLVQGVIGVVMALYIVVGARDERHVDSPLWPEGVTVESLARPVLELPVETPVEIALRSAAGREIVLIGADGVAVSILDPMSARSLAARAPGTPAGQAAFPVRPETVVLFSDGPAELSEQLRTVASPQFLVIGEDGMPFGVLRREDVPRGVAAPDRGGR